MFFMKYVVVNTTYVGVSGRRAFRGGGFYAGISGSLLGFRGLFAPQQTVGRGVGGVGQCCQYHWLVPGVITSSTVKKELDFRIQE